MFLTYRYDLRPTRAQYDRLDQITAMQRHLYNAALQERIDAWRYGKALAARRGSDKPDAELDKPWAPVTLYTQYKALTDIRSNDPEGYGLLPATLCRATLKRLDLAFKGFYARVKVAGTPGFPRFKSASRWKGFGFSEFSGVRLVNGKLHFKGLAGGLKLHMHRPLPEHGQIRGVELRRSAKGWTVFLQIELPDSENIGHPGPSAGLDVGVDHFVALSTGEIIANPRIGQKASKVVRRLRRALARCRRNSKRRKKVKAKLLRELSRIANRRKTFLHQVSADLTGRYGLIVVEDLTLRNMTRSAKGTVEAPGRNVQQKAGLNREVLDVAPGIFVNMLSYKAERAGGLVIRVDPRNTSQMCSGCGAIVRKSLSVRTHRCSCGVVLDRDVNAARNILARAVVGPEDAKPAMSGSSWKAQNPEMLETAFSN